MTDTEKDFGPRFRQEQREREAFLRNTRATVTKQINAAIAEAGGNVRNALNGALAGRDAAVVLLEAENEKVVALLEVLETIRLLCWKDHPPSAVACAIDKIASEALRIAGQT